MLQRSLVSEVFLGGRIEEVGFVEVEPDFDLLAGGGAGIAADASDKALLAGGKVNEGFVAHWLGDVDGELCGMLGFVIGKGADVVDVFGANSENDGFVDVVCGYVDELIAQLDAEG